MAESSFLIRSCRVGVVNSDHQMIVSADIRGNMDASNIEKPVDTATGHFSIEWIKSVG